MASKEQKAREAGIILGSRNDFRQPCPSCSPTRKKKRDPCLHVTVESDRIKYACHHCHDFKGIFSDDDERFGSGLPRRAGSGRGTSGPARASERPSRWW